MARLALGLWQGSDEDQLRVSVLKNTRGTRGATGNRCIVLYRDKESALVHNDGGKIIDLEPTQ